MKNIVITTTLLFILLFVGACSSGSDNDGFRGEVVDVEKIVVDNTATDVPTLIVIMNWDNYTENDASYWSKKFFDTSSGGVSSVNRWYLNNTNAGVNLVPARESYGTNDDGVIIVKMNEYHPGDANTTLFRKNEITKAIGIADTSIDFASYDNDNNNYINSKELQIIFIVSGGEMAYGDLEKNSVWAHAWNYDGGSTPPSHDGVKLMNYDTDKAKLGSYAVFGSTHGVNAKLNEPPVHKATIGIICHELGHSLYNLVDLYDYYDGLGSGIGYYGMMSAGAWGQKNNSKYAGEEPIQFSAFMKQDLAENITSENIYADNISLKCSANEMIKLKTDMPNEYFLLECRDTKKDDSDRAFEFTTYTRYEGSVASGFTSNQLFSILYHIDEKKEFNSENGLQTVSNHYKVSVIQNDINTLMTDTPKINANINHVYIEGQVIGTSKTQPYGGGRGYNIEVLSADYNNRTMTFRIQK